MTRNRLIIVAVLLSVFVLGSVARNSLAALGNPVQPNVAIQPPWLPTESPGVTPVPDLSLPAIQAAIAAFALELEVAPETIRVVNVQPTKWPSSALGCPKSGENYLPVITPGYVVMLEAGEDAQFAPATYHTSDGSVGPLHVVRCDSVVPSTGQGSAQH
jgi:hypothetical protein